MTGLPAEPRPDHKPMAQRVWWLVSVIADVAAVLTVFASSAQTIAVVFGVVALLLGLLQLGKSLGKPVDRWVLFAVAGIVAGAVTIAVVTTRSVVERPAQASGGTSGGTTTAGPALAEPTASELPPTTTLRSNSAAPGIRRTSGDKPILLTDGYAVDLDSQEPNWGANRLIDVPGRDLYYSAGTLWADKDLAPATAQATLDDCVRAGYRPHNGNIELANDAAFCVKTTSGAYARIVITAVDSRGNQLTLDVVVWQRPT